MLTSFFLLPCCPRPSARDHHPLETWLLASRCLLSLCAWSSSLVEHLTPASTMPSSSKCLPAATASTSTGKKWPADHCSACFSEYRAGTNTKPKRKSRRDDGLCKRHAPPKTVTVLPRKRVQSKQSPLPLPDLPKPQSHYCPKCYQEFRIGSNAKPKRKSHRADGLCKRHAPPKTSTVPPRRRVQSKQSPLPLPELPQPPSHYCPECFEEFRMGRNNQPTRKSHGKDGLCIVHMQQSNMPTRKRRAASDDLTDRKRFRLRSKLPCKCMYIQAYRRCTEPDCEKRARVGLLCKAHHSSRLFGLRGMRSACRNIVEHKDAEVPKHCLNNATAAHLPSVSSARTSTPHVCNEARFHHECSNPRCRAQYFPEEMSKQACGPSLFTLCCIRGRFSNFMRNFPFASAQQSSCVMSRHVGKPTRAPAITAVT